jgi:uncharacterized Ntn-hydrolase superfamily protein
MTFSVVARDPETGDLGCAVQSRFLAVAAAVPYARADVAAIATQALANLSYGPRGLALIEAGATAEQALAVLTGADERAERRQAAIVDARGRVAAHTGSGCSAWAGHAIGDGFSCQGNILVSGATIEAMATAMEGSQGMPLAGRLVAALEAGQAAGGDSRGQQSAGLLVVRAGGGYGGQSDRLVDLRVDDAAHPISELARLLRLHELYFSRPAEDALIPIDAALAEEIARRLDSLGGPTVGSAESTSLWQRLERWAGRENLEERMIREGFIDPLVLRVLRGEDPLAHG